MARCSNVLSARWLLSAVEMDSAGDTLDRPDPGDYTARCRVSNVYYESVFRHYSIRHQCPYRDNLCFRVMEKHQYAIRAAYLIDMHVHRIVTRNRCTNQAN